ncbi:MAG TPA: hypothetical protein VM901_10160 [Bdellovibrionota bacterium]|jgi:hypothetical protein|nr:hypothetical protein [Bdellovibrionota bacterium]
MPQRLKKTKAHRDLKKAKLGARNKRIKENQGTTASFPLEGAIPSLRAGRKIAAEKIIVPASK